MVWSPRSFYAAAMLLTSTLPLMSVRIASPPMSPVVVVDAVGLTLGEDAGHGIIVTSLRSGGAADRGGIAVGDRLYAVAGRPVTGLAVVRRLIRAPDPCTMVLTLRRASRSYNSRIWKCDRTGDRKVRRSIAGKRMA